MDFHFCDMMKFTLVQFIIEKKNLSYTQPQVVPNMYEFLFLYKRRYFKECMLDRGGLKHPPQLNTQKLSEKWETA